MFIQTESTPNPNSLKFLPGRQVMPQGTLDMRSANDAAASPLAAQLMALDGVEGVFYGIDFISVTKAASGDWTIIKPHVQARIMDFYMSGEVLLHPMQSANSEAPAEQSSDPIIREIMAVIETHIKPGVARDGGDVKFIEFDQGVVYLEMRGACAGCPAAGITLKSGIEKIMKTYIPEVNEVVSIT
ncbi:MAG TPA: NifU family protein [Alphaproteobacteria bacterium]|nr:NifU family protein [Rhodospirillaceae bacterium]HRJ12257.1 NifU family protein [Alphaproteobacteria bacterium]